jgi:hypothetical protein
MNIQGNTNGPERAKQSYEQQQRALIDANRALVRAAREELSSAARERLARLRAEGAEHAEVRRSAQRDEVELSAAARAASEPSNAEREAHVRELAEAHRMERLHSPERIERAAQRLLEG